MTFPAGVLLSSLSASGWGDLLSFVVRATLIAGAGTIVCYQLRKASAAKRHLAAMATLIALIALPIAMAFLPAVPLPILPAVSTPATFRVETPTAPVDQAAGVLPPEHNDVISSEVTESTVSPTTPVSSRRSPSEYVVLASLAVSAALLLQVLVSFAAAALTVRQARRIEDADLERELDSARRRLGVSRSISLRECPSVTIPSVWGWARPVLLLPVEAREWGRERIRVVFLHEVAHVARHDGVGLLLTRIATSVFWFHPLVWKLARMARRECERCCDDLVLAAGERATDYAAHLLAMVRSMTRPDGFTDVAPALAQESNLESRLLSILHPGQRRDSISPSGLVVTIGLAALLLVATTVVQVVAAPAPPVESEIWQQVKQANRDARQQARQIEAALEAAAGAGAEVKLSHPKSPSTCTSTSSFSYAFSTAPVEVSVPDVPMAPEVSVAPNVSVVVPNVSVVVPNVSVVVPRVPVVPQVPRVSIAVSPSYSASGSWIRQKPYSDGIDLMRDGQYSKAITAFQEEIRETGSTNAMYNLACAYALKGDKKLAFDSLQKAIENGFDNTHHMTEDDDLVSLQGDPHFYELVRLARDLQLFNSGMFGGMNGEKDWSGQLSRLERVTREHPTIGRAWANLGLARLEAGDPKGGVAAYQKALDLGYEKPTTLYNMACCAARAGDVDGAFKYLDRAEQAGFEIGQYVGSDSDMDALRGDARYGAMLKRWDEKMAKEHRDKLSKEKQKTD